jgi:PAS domain S-box-containing protein
MAQAQLSQKTRLRALGDPIGLLEGLFAHAPVAIQVFSQDGRCVLVNEAFRALFGGEPPPSGSLFQSDPEEQRLLCQAVRRAFEGEVGELEPHWWSSEALWAAEGARPRRVGLELKVTPVHGPMGEVRYAAIFFSDVTAELQRAQHIEELQELTASLGQSKELLLHSEEQLRLAMQAARVGIFEWNIRTGVTQWSPELEEMHGLAAGTATHTFGGWESLVHPDDRAAALDTIQRAFETMLPVEGEWRVIWPDGSVHWLAGRFRVFTGKDGHPQRMLGVNIDITDRKQGELALQGAAARLEILASTSRAFAATATEYQPLLDTIARSVAEQIGDGCAVMLASDDRKSLLHAASAHRDPKLAEVYAKAVAPLPIEYESSEIVTARVMRTGEPMMVAIAHPEEAASRVAPELREAVIKLNIHSFAVVPIRARGQVIGLLSLFRSRPGYPYDPKDVELLQDLADRAGLAIDSARLYQQLEDRVAERTAELERANRELGAFSYSVSHDLRTPLRAIDGFSRALSEDYADKLDAEGHRYLERVRSGALKMSHLTDDLLALAQLTRTQIEGVPVDLSGLVRGAYDELKAREPSREVELVAEPGLTAHADRRLMGIVIENLMGNAWKFTSKTPNARIEFGRTPEGAFFLRDNGVGFDMALARRLFQPFHRLHHPAEFEGSGIGLATSQRIIERHKGRIWAEAAVGKGATFYFTVGS